jgi:hypothetical protein
MLNYFYNISLRKRLEISNEGEPLGKYDEADARFVLLFQYILCSFLRRSHKRAKWTTGEPLSSSAPVKSGLGRGRPRYPYNAGYAGFVEGT